MSTNSKETAFKAIDRNKDEIAKVGDSIFYFAELGMQEVETCKLLVQVLKDMGYTVETGISGFPTGFLASYGSGKPVIAVHIEYDALRVAHKPRGSRRGKRLCRALQVMRKGITRCGCYGRCRFRYQGSHGKA